MTLAIKRVHNLPPRLSYVSTLPGITRKRKLCCLPLSSVSGSEKNRFRCVWSGSEPVVWLNHSSCSKWRPFAFTHACSCVFHWLRRWCPEEYGPRCQWACASLVNAVSRFCV